MPTFGEWKSIVLISLLFFVIGNTSVVQAEQHISSGLAALICSAIPIWVVLINLVMSKAEKNQFAHYCGTDHWLCRTGYDFYDNLGTYHSLHYFLVSFSCCLEILLGPMELSTQRK
ncbi:MAG: hypothetical protein IPG01_15785 [Chitinophagaceae bacterium]|nr:hypothetical protein [Chitinophagaceae bacterium]